MKFLTFALIMIFSLSLNSTFAVNPIQSEETSIAYETIQLDGMSITGIKATHGALTLKFGPFSKTIKPGPEERIGWGAVGFKIQLDGKTVGLLVYDMKLWQHEVCIA